MNYWSIVAIFLYPTCIWHPRWGLIRWSFVNILGTRKLNSPLLSHHAAPLNAWWCMRQFRHNTGVLVVGRRDGHQAIALLHGALTLHSEVYAMAGVSLSQCRCNIERLYGSNWFSAQRLPPDYPSLRCKGIYVFPSWTSSKTTDYFIV